MPVFVGCDLGTMGTKAAVVDEEGSILGEDFEEIPLRSPAPGHVEQDLAEIEASAHRTIRAALERSRRSADVAAVAFSGQMSGIGSIDHRFEPTAHFDSWLDTRCEPYIVRMQGAADRITELSGCPPTYSHGPKILWWREQRPHEFERIARFVVPGAYVAGRLAGLSAGEAFIDRTYVHFSNLADTAAAQWSSELLETFGLDDGKLPRIVAPQDVVGEVSREGAERTGLPAGTPIAAGAGDQAAASLGAAVVDPGQAFDSAGTASVFAICVGSFAPDLAQKTLLASHSVIEGVYIALAFINGGGLALRWFRDELAPELTDDADAYRTLDTWAEQTPPGAGGLLWYPHVQGGVLPPRPHARGAWVGVTSAHGRGHLFRAILEGIAYEYAHWGATAPGELSEARALGGGARSALWNGIKADVLGIDWVPMVRQECGVLGDALIAARATGHVADLAATARAWQETEEPVRPDPERHRAYARQAAAYRDLGDSLYPIFERLGEARA
ncbi:MAG TPA: FGGY family carbohydrate kinase [Gaiellaceae bacterium]|nr:FGGY family carbohydrate kinase [Gaiellaceae bacterium]